MALLGTMLRKAGLPTVYYAQGCPDHVEEQLAHVGSRYVILCGEEALSHYRPDLTVTQMLGQPLFHHARILWPVHSPAAILRYRYHAPPTLQALVNLRAAIDLDLPPYSRLCVTCGRANSFHDPDGVGYCEMHWRKGQAAYTKLVKARRKNRQSPSAPDMLTG